jgi:hypothetical protein
MWEQQHQQQQHHARTLAHALIVSPGVRACALTAVMHPAMIGVFTLQPSSSSASTATANGTAALIPTSSVLSVSTTFARPFLQLVVWILLAASATGTSTSASTGTSSSDHSDDDADDDTLWLSASAASAGINIDPRALLTRCLLLMWCHDDESRVLAAQAAALLLFHPRALYPRLRTAAVSVPAETVDATRMLTQMQVLTKTQTQQSARRALFFESVVPPVAGATKLALRPMGIVATSTSSASLSSSSSSSSSSVALNTGGTVTAALALPGIYGAHALLLPLPLSARVTVRSLLVNPHRLSSSHEHRHLHQITDSIGSGNGSGNGESASSVRVAQMVQRLRAQKAEIARRIQNGAHSLKYLCFMFFAFFDLFIFCFDFCIFCSIRMGAELLHVLSRSACLCLPCMCHSPIVSLPMSRYDHPLILILLIRLCFFSVFLLIIPLVPETGTLAAFAFDSHLSALSLPAAVRHCLDGTVFFTRLRISKQYSDQ